MLHRGQGLDENGRYHRPLQRINTSSAPSIPPGIDATRKEEYLNEPEFQQVFGMDRDAFKKLPAWRQAQAKKKANLF